VKLSDEPQLYNASVNSAYYAAFQCAKENKTMINFKQMELAEGLFNKLKAKFPEIELVNIVEHPENPNGLRVRIIMPEDDDRRIALTETAAEISTDILLDYGYDILIGSASPTEKEIEKV
jgi:hypothetical protein